MSRIFLEASDRDAQMIPFCLKIMISQVDLSDPEQLDGRQLEFMQKKAKVRSGEETAQPPQIFNKTYRGVTFFSFPPHTFARLVSPDFLVTKISMSHFDSFPGLP